LRQRYATTRNRRRDLIKLVEAVNLTVLDLFWRDWGVCRHCKMGRRRSKRKPAPKRRQDPLEQQFNCPFCNHERSCDVKMDRVRNCAYISCRVCLEEFQTTITYLSEPVDVYSDWIDACETANQWRTSHLFLYRHCLHQWTSSAWFPALLSSVHSGNMMTSITHLHETSYSSFYPKMKREGNFARLLLGVWIPYGCFKAWLLGGWRWDDISDSKATVQEHYVALTA